MWDAAAALTPAPREHREALRRAWAGQHGADPRMPLQASGPASPAPHAVPVPQGAPPSLSARPALPDAPSPAVFEPASLFPGPLPERPVLTGEQTPPLPPHEPGALNVTRREVPGWQPEREDCDQAARLARDHNEPRQWVPPDVPGQQQVLRFLHQGTVTVGDVLASRDPVAHRTDAGLMVEAACHLGPDAAAALIGQAGIEAGSHVDDLTVIQRERLLQAVSAYAPFRGKGSRADAGPRIR